ncbi:MAG: PQQ-like beta-propeller repeat protein, partial [Ktedonobacteraceae bacterium]|nr:PQQ-like beta-propeller repeat protein [Ktedonobacteraceae bacterium]
MRLSKWLLRIVPCLLCCLLMACAGPSPSPPVHLTISPTPSMAAREPVLPHSQIFYQKAPLPSTTDVQFNSSTWTLPGHDSLATHAVDLARGSLAHKAAPLWYHAFASPLLFPPIVGDQAIYQLASDGYLHVLRLKDGSEAWSMAVGGDLTTNGLALAHNLLYLALDSHFIAAVDAQSGVLRWRFDTGGVVRAAPLVVGQDLLVASGPNSLWCLNALTGARYWVFHSEDALTEFWPTRTSPVVFAGVVYTELGASSEVNALSLSTGRKVWEASLPERVIGGPVLDIQRNLLYLVTWSGRVVALDIHTGATRWDTHLPAGSQASPALAVQPGLLYIGGFAQTLYALDTRSGRIAWRTAL